jgi:hypothetical protein
MSCIESLEYYILEKIKSKIPNKKYKLTQSDFDYGTLRIRKSGRYVFQENITFSPNPDNDFRPLPKQKEYEGRAYSLGFFAAIAVEADGVEIDLNGYTLKQGDACAWLQRFYANIETASSPFIPGQGPGNFGKKITSPKYIYIHNGTLGRSSHHAIHGNGNKYLWVEDVTMVDYEFIGSAINGGKYIVHKNCDVLHNFQDLKVLATWSAALFAKQFADKIADNLSDDFHFKDLKNRLDRAIAITKRELLSNRPVSERIFKNTRLVADGAVFGILSHPLGVAIHKFSTQKSLKDNKPAEHFIVDNCKICDLTGDVDEVVSLKDPEGKGIKGTSGDLLKLKDCMEEDGSYRGNFISDVYMYMAELKKQYPKIDVGTLYIPDDVIEWSKGNVSYNQLLRRGYKFLTGHDSMEHVGKGVLGIRLDGTNNVSISNVSIYNIKNIARLGSEYNKVQQRLYLGGIASAIHISYCKDVILKNSHIQTVISENSEATGVKAIHHSSVIFRQSKIDVVKSGYFLR